MEFEDLRDKHMLTETNENELDDMLLLNDEDMARILSNESSSSNGCEMESRGMVQHDFELQDGYCYLWTTQLCIYQTIHITKRKTQ